MAIGMVWAVSGVLMLIATELFEPEAPHSPSASGRQGGGFGSSESDQHGSSTRRHISHHLVSIILSLSSCVLYVVADIAIFHLGFDESSVRPVLVCAWASAVAAVPLTVLVRSP
jgi:hypothetical protein